MAEKTYFFNQEVTKSHVDLNYLDLDQHEQLWKHVIDTHPFNKALSVFLPSCSINLAEEHMSHSLGVYYEVEAPLSILLDREFFQLYLQSDNSQLMMHTLDTHLNTDDVVVLTPKGELVFSLTKTTFETFGMPPIKQTKADIKHVKHIVKVDLKDRSFKPDSKLFNRLKWCFENTLTRSFRMVFCAFDKLTKTTIDMQWPLSVKEITRKEMKPEFDTLTDIDIPTFQNMMYDMDQQQEASLQHWDTRAMEAIEWIGLAHLKASRLMQKSSQQKPVDPFVSVYEPPVPLSDSAHTGTLVRFKGFISAFAVDNMMTMLRKLMASGVTKEWIALTSWGFKDSPYTWDKFAHYHYYNGENDYTFLLLPNNRNAYMYQFYGSHHVKT
ncbi:ribonuclease P 40kDa subunit-domain-containing protein [Mycotypha africana]|uniref:ribonuclease P 40kDa subunit-domain-containing protein n=1 Tax=Mycotypha africana TaxID=64632 RepID=UPI0022FFFF36|nr:ribonuclease P 40kDa subunit-domain-containing protein [Mycotypha africana]KAI8973617.1 ribonuclease P 40kDa subunit-domain-containing protein [Mycotypha africana]